MDFVDLLSGQVRDWLGRTMERLASSEQGLAYAGDADRGAGREGVPDLASRMREAWEARQNRRETVSEQGERQSPAPAADLAARLREAAQGIDRAALSERAAELQQSREAEEAERLKELERQLEREREAYTRDSGPSHSL